MVRLIRIYREDEEDGDGLPNEAALEDVYRYLTTNGYFPDVPSSAGYVQVAVDLISPNEHLDFLQEMGWTIGLVG